MTTEKTLLEKIASIQDKIGPMVKDSKAFNYKYADLNQILEKLQPLLKEENLVLTQPIKDGHVTTRINLTSRDDLFIESSLRLPEDVKPQDMGSAITYYRRYTLMSLLALQAEDDDGKAAQDSGNKGSVPSVTPPVGLGLSPKRFAEIRDGYAAGTLKPTPEDYEAMNATQRKTINDLKLIKRKENAKV